MKTLTYLLMAGCVLGLEIGSALGQEDSGGCGICVCAADNQCYSESSSCATSATTDCRSTAFTVPCAQTYTIKALMSCSGEEQCKECFACVRVFNGNTEIGVCHNTCNAYDCSEECGVNLSANTTYTLYVCLRTCSNGSCANCDCTARGYVYENWSDCNTIPSCNP